MSEAVTSTRPVVDRRVPPQPSPGTARSQHWARPDAARDVLALAWAPGLAPPRQIRVRPELHDRLLAELDPAARVALTDHGLLGEPAGVPVVIDPALPGCPGFEVQRVRPGGPVRLRGAA
ncbi:hypothetical protein [Geodermatophilus poikilotrophus]|uniref:Uncharacterized protein n=1 Tax=Geodermatophilus poikilotrophus TaxID=1333667 RepID=A0A1I0CYE9_9ACTN|nr:hypothetical protein [Geodermatophilus poikilotrophus]SET24817.1 hypothetical protein SAMN04488546_1828 [Geodermatophilus poikilotrophus]